MVVPRIISLVLVLAGLSVGLEESQLIALSKKLNYDDLSSGVTLQQCLSSSKTPIDSALILRAILDFENVCTGGNVQKNISDSAAWIEEKYGNGGGVEMARELGRRVTCTKVSPDSSITEPSGTEAFDLIISQILRDECFGPFSLLMETRQDEKNFTRQIFDILSNGTKAVSRDVLNTLFLDMGLKQETLDTKINTTNNCWDIGYLFDLYDWDKSKTIDEIEFEELAPAIIYERLTLEGCVESQENKGKTDKIVYLWGSIAVFVISIFSALGAILTLAVSKQVYEYVILSFIALAFGTMSADAVIHIIPDCLQLEKLYQTPEGEIPSYYYKLVALQGTIYALFLFECLTGIFAHKDEDMVEGKHGHSHIPDIMPQDVEAARKAKQQAKENGHSHGRQRHQSESHELEDESDRKKRMRSENSVSSISTIGNPNIVCCNLNTLALIIILGDALHNVGDGLAIGAAFCASVSSGLSTSLAVLCHEVPHELGDFAILLMCGLSIKQALIWNLVSASTAFVGLYIGLLIGEDEEARMWIFTVTAGMFLYVAIGDMMPELKNYQTKNKWLSLIAENIGAIFGMVFMAVFFIFEDKITWG